MRLTEVMEETIMQRRQFCRGALALGALSLAEFGPWQGISAFAREMDEFIRGPVVRDIPLQQLSPHVWMIYSPDGFPTPENQGMMCNLTFVDTSAGLVVLDTGASVQIGEMAIRQLARQFPGKKVVALFNSHYHGDHFLGNQAFVEAFGDLPIHAHPGTVEAIAGLQGNSWRTLMEKWTNQATLGTRVVVPNRPVQHGQEFRFGDVTLRIHHYGRAHTPSDICVQVLEDQLTHVGDVAMDRRIANMDDGSYVGTFKFYEALEREAPSSIWVPGHGHPGPDVLGWNRELFQGIYETCVAAVEAGRSMEAAKELVLQDPRVSSRARDTRGFETHIGKYVSLAYLEAEASAF